MPSFDTDLVALWTAGRWVSRPKSPIAGFSVDSRRISAGFAFVALKTGKRDGHDFVAAAYAAGAAAAIVSREIPGVAIPQLVVRDPLVALQSVAREHRRRFKGPVVGITGSAGKTSTKELTALLLGGEGGGVLATEANLNNHIGVALTLCRLDPSRHRVAVVEAGISAPGEMDVLAGMIEPDIAVITLIGPAHLEELGGLEGVAREKSALARALRPSGLSIFPSSCLVYQPFRDLPAERSLVLEPVSRIQGMHRQQGRVPFSIEHEEGSTLVSIGIGALPGITLSLRRVSDGMAQNAALAACASMRAGAERSDVESRICDWQPASMRGEWRTREGQTVYLDCYNANPASMTDALSVFEAVAPKGEPRLFLIGCMEELGDDAPRYHFELGRSLRLSPGDRLMVVGGLAGEVVKGALAAGIPEANVEASETVGPLAERVSRFRGAVFVKGSRRHELESAFRFELEGAAHA